MACTVVNSQSSLQTRLPALPGSIPANQSQWTQFLNVLHAWGQALKQTQHTPNVIPQQLQTFSTSAASAVTGALTSVNCTPSVDATQQFYGGASLKSVITVSGATLRFTGTPIVISSGSRWFCGFQILTTTGISGSLSVVGNAHTLTESFTVPASASWQQVWGLFDFRSYADTQAAWEFTFNGTGTLWLDGMQMNAVGDPLSNLPPFAGAQMVAGSLADATNLDGVPDGAARFATVNGSGLNAVSSVDPAKRALIDFSQSGHTNKTVDNVADGVTYGRTLLGGLASGYAAKTGAAGTYSIKGVGDTQTLNLDSEIVDGATHGRTLLTALTSGQVDLSKAGVIGRTFANVTDGGGRFAVTNAAAMNGVSYVDAGNRALIDFTQAAHVGKTIDNIGDGATYARTLASALSTGQVDFSASGMINKYRSNLTTGFDGTNVVENPEFIGGNAFGWSLNAGATVIAAASAPTGCPTAYCVKVATQNGSVHTDCYAGLAAESYMRVHPGQKVRFSLTYATDSTFNGYIRAGVYWLEGDGATGISWTNNAPVLQTASQPWNTVEWYETAPANAVYARPWFTNLGVASGAAGAWYATLFRAGGMTGPADTTKGDIATTGTVPPGASTVGFSYTSTTTSITWSWTAGTLYRMDGTSTAVGSGSQTVTGLSNTTTYNFGIYYDEEAGAIKLLTGGSGAVGSPLAAYTSQAAVNTAAIYAQTHAPFGWMTAATGSSGGGSAGCCLHGRQLIELARGEFVEAGALKEGDVLTSPEGSTPVVKLRIEPWYEWFRVTLRNGVTLRLAGDHRFIDPAGDQVLTRDLRLQQVVVTKHGYTAVSALEYVSELGDKVSIEVGAPHVYYVDGILAHNKVFC